MERKERELGKTKPQIRTQTREVDSVISGDGKRGTLPGLTLPHVTLLPPSPFTLLSPHIVKLWKTIRTESFIKFAQPSHTPELLSVTPRPLPLSRLLLTSSLPPHPPPSKAISYPHSAHFSVSLQPLLLLFLFYRALISKVTLRVPKIISNGITLNEMQSSS